MGTHGADVALLQTRLNARAKALPALLVDGDFGPATLQRVKEFQSNEFVTGIVDAGTWNKLLAGAPGGKDTYFTQGRNLFDPAGNKVILRGVNKMSVWDFDDPTGAIYFPEIRKTGANTVRIVWTTKDDRGFPTDVARLDALVTNARQSQLIPMIELHDATGNWDGLQELVDYWIQPAILALIQKHQACLLLNIGNEVGDDQVSKEQFIAGYANAVGAMRAAGIRTPLVIDASDWGKDLAMLDASAATLIGADALQNLVFSVHLYWAKSCGADAQYIRGNLEASVALAYPLIVGEFSKYGGFPCSNPGSSICSAAGEIDYQTILQVCHEHEIGWYVWEWGPGNALGTPPDPLCAAMDMTPDGLFAHIKPGWAEEVAISSPFGLAQSALPEGNIITAAPGGDRDDPEGVAARENVTLITWKDARGADRTLTLGGYLHQYAFSFDDNQQVVMRTANDNAYGHPGFGYVVSHNVENGNSPLGKANVPGKVDTLVFSGGHHAIHRIELVYDRDQEAGGEGIAIPVVIQWFVATGRDHPVWSVTWMMADAQNPQNVDFDEYRMDVRGPYGSLNFDGAADADQGDAIGGVAWGDCGFRFETTDAQLTLDSGWTYDTPNSVNFVQAWAATANAEMGIVQTRPSDKELGYPDRVVGRERGQTSAAGYLEKSHCSDWGDQRNYALPCINGWPYQLMNYDWDPEGGKPVDEATSTKLLAWGSPYGWLGAPTFDLFDFSALADGRGDRSYATFIVLGPKRRFNPQNGRWDGTGDVSLAIAAVEALAAATVGDVNPGWLLEQVPKGPGADETKSIVNGYDDTYAAFCLAAEDNRVSFTFTPAYGQVIENPIFVIHNYTEARLPKIVVADEAVTVNVGAESGAFVSLNPAANELWVTLHITISQGTTVRIMQDR
jgi:mannan endo-1,4-beta-mannosidase